MRLQGRSLDHLVVFASNLGLASECYRRLGFRVLPMMEHIDLGTSNAIVSFKDTYLELLGDLDYCRHQALSEQVAERMHLGDGLYMTSLTSDDLDVDRLAMPKGDIEFDPVVNARRRLRLPDGGWHETESRSMYAWNRARPLMSFFLSDHRKPELIWITDYQCHPNTTERVIRLTYMAANPTQDLTYLTALLGFDPEVCDRNGVTYRTPRNELLEILSPAVCSERYGQCLPRWAEASGAYGIAFTCEVGSLNHCRWTLRDNGVPFVEADGVLRVDAAFACGMVVEFREAT
jgi:hypothetical protein